MEEFESIRVEVASGRAKVTMMWPDGARDRFVAFKRDFPTVLQQLRDDDSVRVVVLTGAGGKFLSTMGAGHSFSPESAPARDPRNTYKVIRKNGELLETLISMEKPVVAMVNGDALAIGATMALLCDFVIADENALISDAHIAQSHFVPGLSRDAGVVPGDGGAIAWPSQMSLIKAKEYLMLGRPVKAKELAQLHAINAAVPAEQLESAVDEIVNELLARPAWALAWTKVLLNKQLKQQMTQLHDAGFALELHSIRAHSLEGGKGITHL